MKYKIAEFTKDFYKPGEVAMYLGVSSRTVSSYCSKGLLGEVITDTGRRVIPRDSLIGYLKDKDCIDFNVQSNRRDVIYCRVSTHAQANRGDLQRQVDTVLSYCALENPKDVVVLKEVGSGLNDNRKQLRKLLNMIMNEEVDRVYVSYKDRLTRFGFNYIEEVCKHFKTRIVVVSNELNDKSMEEELAEDLCAIIHSFSGKLYGMRSKVKKCVDSSLGGELDGTGREADS